MTYGYIRVSTREQNGDRQLIALRKPSGLAIAMALNIDRDQFQLPHIIKRLLKRNPDISMKNHIYIGIFWKLGNSAGSGERK